MKIIEIRIEGGYIPKCVRPTIETETGEKIMLGFTDASKVDATFTAQGKEHGDTVPDLAKLKALINLLPTQSDNIIIKDDVIMVQEKGKLKEFKSQITPVDNPLEVAPDVTGIDEICSIVHTDLVKRKYRAVNNIPMEIK